MKHVEVSEKIVGAYRMWHQKHPTKAYEMTFNFPDVLPLLGTALRIVYWSDKWEKSGGYHYEHDFDSRPLCYGEHHLEGTEPEVFKETAKDLLKTTSVNEQMQFPVLGEVVEVSVDVPEEGVRTLQFRKPPFMLCTADMKGVVILHKRPIIIRGSKMHVTERGIVN